MVQKELLICIFNMFLFLLQFGAEFIQFNTELCLRALKKDRHRLDSARVKKEDEEADLAADGLARTCRQIANVYETHYHMCLVSLMVPNKGSIQ